jgi:hypothetical protein
MTKRSYVAPTVYEHGEVVVSTLGPSNRVIETAGKLP